MLNTILKAFFVLKVFTLLSLIFGYVEKTVRLEKKVNLKVHDVTTRLGNNRNTHIAQWSRSKINQSMKFSQLIGHNKIIIFLKNLTENEAVRLVPDLFF